MQAFEEWYPHALAVDPNLSAMSVWRAALEWLQVQKYRSDQRLSLEESIEQELEETE